MCTASWLRTKAGYELFFNRDEQHARRGADGPAVRAAAGVRYISPQDGDEGGTWIGVNEFALSLAVLNYYQPVRKEPEQTYTSRGFLLNGLIGCDSREEMLDRLSGPWLNSFRSFTILFLDPSNRVITANWNRADQQLYVEEDVRSPVSSSSVNTSEIVQYREGLFRETIGEMASPSASDLEAYHRGHYPKPGPYSVCMHRDDAASVSLSRISVTPADVHFYYSAGPPCESGFQAPVSMVRNYINTSRHYVDPDTQVLF